MPCSACGNSKKSIFQSPKTFSQTFILGKKKKKILVKKIYNRTYNIGQSNFYILGRR